ncbi:MAG: NFACT family protein [Clostridia bacterium]|nr:NFACT family protein [Clostridia bacterium]
MRSAASRIHFTEQKTENPENPPMFCMLMRKHFVGAKLSNVSQRGFERIVEIGFEALNEMGDRVNLKIVCELIGNQSNCILLNGEGRIIDALKRSDISAKRLILPGAVYEYPEPQNNISITETSELQLANNIISKGQTGLSKAILSVIDGISPLVAREMAFRVCQGDVTAECTNEKDLEKQISVIKEEITVKGCPILLKNKENIPVDFSYTDILQYGDLYSKESYLSYSLLLDAFYNGKENSIRLKKLSSDLSKLVSNLIIRANKRMEIRKSELKSCENREMLRIYGELIKANIYVIKPGSNKVELENFYDENLKTISVPLDPCLNAAANAAKYFKEYKKSYKAEQTLTSLIDKDKEEIDYLETVAQSLECCETAADIAEIRQELNSEGYIKGATPKNKKIKTAEFKEYKSVEGYKIIVGKNNVQNDYITTRLASKNDLWFHTKGIHGSHVVLFCGGGKVSDETILFAARLAAKNSKAALSSNVPVDYTPIKNVKKPAGSKPGMVIYSTNKTVFVTSEGNYD